MPCRAGLDRQRWPPIRTARVGRRPRSLPRRRSRSAPASNPPRPRTEGCPRAARVRRPPLGRRWGIAPRPLQRVGAVQCPCCRTMCPPQRSSRLAQRWPTGEARAPHGQRSAGWGHRECQRRGTSKATRYAATRWCYLHRPPTDGIDAGYRLSPNLHLGVDFQYGIVLTWISHPRDGRHRAFDERNRERGGNLA
jgi:hypothetical protein